MAAGYACLWRAPFTSCHMLDTLALPGAVRLQTYPQAITADGSTIYGSARHPDGRYRAVKWNTTTLAITVLSEVFTDQDQYAAACSADGSVVIGGNGEYSGPFTRMTRWTGGGTSGAALGKLNPASTTGIGNPTSAAQTLVPRIVSDDGTINTGNETHPNSPPYSGATFWLNGVATALPGAAWQTILDFPAQGYCISADGLRIVGTSGYDNAVTGPQYEGDVCYWFNLTTTPTLRRLVVPTEIQNKGFNIGSLCNGDASSIWGKVAEGTHNYPIWCWYTNVTTPVGDGIHYGTYQMLPRLPNTQGVWETQFLYKAADDPGVAIVVGSCSYGVHDMHACKWTGATLTDLGTLPGHDTAEAVGCNHDGTVICGYSVAGWTTGIMWAVRWDASNTIHMLPSLADPSLAFMGDAWGVSRNGSVIFGLMLLYEPPPPDVTFAMDDVVVMTEGGLDSNLVSLRWSNNRGHSFGNPVTRSIGEIGQYKTSLQWQRLSYARDRVWEISWTVPCSATLQGCWVDATTAKS